MEEEKMFSLWFCFTASIFIVCYLITGSPIFLVIFLLIVCIGMLFEKQPFRIDFLLFFISWVYVIKFNQESMSLFVFISLFYIAISVVSFSIQQTKISLRVVLALFLFCTYVLTVSFGKGASLSPVIGFLLNFTVILFAIYSTRDVRHMKRYSYMYVLGLLTTCFVNLFGNVVPSVKDYIESMTEVNTVIVNHTLFTRFSGLDLDPNYFGIQVLFAISCLLVLTFYQKKNVKEMSMMIVLTIFGVLSLSKMFIMTILFLIILSLLLFLKNNQLKALKYVRFLLVIGGAGVVLFYEKLYAAYWMRFFGFGRSTEALTTGRIESWEVYVKAIFSHEDIIIFGAGVGTSFLHDLMAHNMYITTFYYLGLIGIILVLFYGWELLRSLQLHLNTRGKFQFFAVSSLPLYMTLFANNALDSLMMDFFLLHSFLIILSIVYRGQLDRGI